MPAATAALGLFCFPAPAQGEALRCRTGIVTNSEPCAVPALRSGMKNAAPRPGHRSFLLQLALRVEVADAAAFAAGAGIEHRVDQRRLAGIHRGVHRALQLVRRGGVDADAAKSFHHPVVARALDEY